MGGSRQILRQVLDVLVQHNLHVHVILKNAIPFHNNSMYAVYMHVGKEMYNNNIIMYMYILTSPESDMHIAYHEMWSCRAICGTVLGLAISTH